MNHGNSPSSRARMDVFASRVIAQLDQGNEDFPPDITERLRFAREQALAQRRLALSAHSEVQATPVKQVSFISRMVPVGLRLWLQRWGMTGAPALALVALAVGMVSIQQWQDESLAAEVAEVDAALLVDELPPSAYADPGFIQYMRTNDISVH